MDEKVEITLVENGTKYDYKVWDVYLRGEKIDEIITSSNYPYFYIAENYTVRTPKYNQLSIYEPGNTKVVVYDYFADGATCATEGATCPAEGAGAGATLKYVLKIVYSRYKLSYIYDDIAQVTPINSGT